MANPERWKRFEDLPEDLHDRLGNLPRVFEERGVLVAYLFGSLAEGADRVEEKDTGRRRDEDGRLPGDVDLAILAGGDFPFDLRADLQRALGTERLDLVDLARASPRLRFHIVRDGRLLFAHDDETLNRFELRTLHLYRDTAPLRRRHQEYLRERLDAWS